MKAHDVRKLKVGRWVRVKYDDVGARDGIVVEKDHRDDPKPHTCKVFFPFEGVDSSVEPELIIAVGDSLQAKESGLP